MKKKHLPVYWEKLQSVYMYSLIEYKPGEVSDPGPSALDIEQPGGMNILPDIRTCWKWLSSLILCSVFQEKLSDVIGTRAEVHFGAASKTWICLSCPYSQLSTRCDPAVPLCSLCWSKDAHSSCLRCLESCLVAWPSRVAFLPQAYCSVGCSWMYSPQGTIFSLFIHVKFQQQHKLLGTSPVTAGRSQQLLRMQSHLAVVTSVAITFWSPVPDALDIKL